MTYGWILTIMLTSGYAQEWPRPFPNKAACEEKAAQVRKARTTESATCDLELLHIQKDRK